MPSGRPQGSKNKAKIGRPVRGGRGRNCGINDVREEGRGEIYAAGRGGRGGSNAERKRGRSVVERCKEDVHSWTQRCIPEMLCVWE